MLNMKSKLVLLTIAGLSLSACSKDSDESAGSALTASDGLLKYVPADTPYVLAMPVALPDDVLDKMEPQTDMMLQMYPDVLEEILRSAIATREENGQESNELEKVMPLLDELDSLLSIEGLRAAGLDRDSRFVMYGAGVLPVFRATLSDGNLLEAAIVKLEESAATGMSVATIGNHEYRYVGDEEGRVIVAIIDDELVISLVPAQLTEEHLKTVLGLTLPGQNIAQSGSLRNVADKYDFENYFVGYIDVQQFASVFLDSQTGVNAELLSMLEFDSAQLTDVCESEMRSIAGVMPRIAAGYTDVSTEKISSKVVVELRDDLATGVATMTGLVPGLGNEQGGILSLGMSVDLLAAREFYSGRLDAMEADPYECEELAEVQYGIMAGREMLNQPLPPIVYGFKGFLAVVEDIEGLDLQNEIPPTSIDMRLLLSMDNVEGLIAMGAMFSPELASLNIEANGEPVKVEMGQLAAMRQTVHAAMTDDAIAVSVGEGTEARLSEMLQADINEPAPFVAFEMDAARYYSFISDAMISGDDPEAMPEIQDATKAMLDAISESISRMSLAVNFSEHGIEIDSTVTLTQ